MKSAHVARSRPQGYRSSIASKRRPRITLMVQTGAEARVALGENAHPMDVHGAYGCDTDDCKVRTDGSVAMTPTEVELVGMVQTLLKQGHSRAEIAGIWLRGGVPPKLLPHLKVVIAEAERMMQDDA